jgi:hypothetical protein
MSESRGPDEFRTELLAKNKAKAATLVALNDLRVEQEAQREQQEQRDLSDARLEAIARDIESTQAGAIIHVAKQLAEAREIFRFRRDEGGFRGWLETRLHQRLVRSAAYNLLNALERFGNNLSRRLDTCAPSVVYLGCWDYKPPYSYRSNSQRPGSRRR